MVTELPVPTAIIVCEGDIQTISHISEALEKQLPVIIMKGSGKAADLVLDYLNKYIASHTNEEIINKENTSFSYNNEFITFMQLEKTTFVNDKSNYSFQNRNNFIIMVLDAKKM